MEWNLRYNVISSSYTQYISNWLILQIGHISADTGYLALLSFSNSGYFAWSSNNKIMHIF